MCMTISCLTVYLWCGNENSRQLLALVAKPLFDGGDVIKSERVVRVDDDWVILEVEGRHEMQESQERHVCGPGSNERKRTLE